MIVNAKEQFTDNPYSSCSNKDQDIKKQEKRNEENVILKNKEEKTDIVINKDQDLKKQEKKSEENIILKTKAVEQTKI